MLPYDIAAIRAVHSDRIRRDMASRHVHDIPRTASSRSIRRAIGLPDGRTDRRRARLAQRVRGPAGSGPTLAHWRPDRDRTHARDPCQLRIRRTQLLPDPPVLGLGSRISRLFRRRGALGLADRSVPRRPRAPAVPRHRRRVLELPLGGVQLDRRHDRGGALGGHPRVHDDGAGSTRHAAARVDAVRGDLRPHPHGRDPRGDDPVLPAAGSDARELSRGRACSCCSGRSASWASAWWRPSCRCSTWSAARR